MRRERKRTIIELAIILSSGLVVMAAVCGLYVLSLAAMFTSGDIPHKSDEELITNFQSCRVEFSRLLQMVIEDRGLERVDVDWTSPGNPQEVGVSQERIDEYRTLFTKIDVPRGFYAFHDQGVFEFIASTQGLAVSGSMKGYIYFKNRPDRVVDDLDKYGQLKDKPYSYPVYRHIEGNWYLFFDAD